MMRRPVYSKSKVVTCSSGVQNISVDGIESISHLKSSGYHYAGVIFVVSLVKRGVAGTNGALDVFCKRMVDALEHFLVSVCHTDSYLTLADGMSLQSVV